MIINCTLYLRSNLTQTCQKYFQLKYLYIFSGIPTGNPIDNDTCAWIVNNSPMKKKYGSKLSIVAWVHSHVEKVECCFSSIDLHTQLTLSQIFPDILGLVFELDGDGDPIKHDFYGLTRHGVTNLRKCKEASGAFHDECGKSSYYTSKMHLIDLFDGPIEVHDFFHINQLERKLMQDKESLARKVTSQKNPSVEKNVFNDIPKLIQSHFEALMEDDAQEENAQNDHQMETQENSPSQTAEFQCEGCGKSLNIDSFLKHVGRAKKCKNYYGERYEKMKKARKLDTEQKRKGKRAPYFKEYNTKHKEEISQKKKIYNQNNKEAISQKKKIYNQDNKEMISQKKKIYDLNNKEQAKQKRFELKIKNRFKKFKMETKDGPSFNCNCCHRGLFQRGM